MAVHNAACPFSASSADLYAVSLQANRTPYAVPSPNNVSASNAFFYNTKLPLLFVLHLFAEAVLFYVPKVFCFVLTPHISGGIIQL